MVKLQSFCKCYPKRIFRTYYRLIEMNSLIIRIIYGKFKARSEGKSGKAIFFLLLTILVLGASACSSVEKARNATDAVVASKNHFNMSALVQAEIERQRLRKMRCHSPLLNPTAISGAAVHPSLGRPWVDELLRDCPEYAAFISELVLRRAEGAGITVQGRRE